MAVKTRLQIDEEVSKDLENTEALDMVYLDEMKQSGLSEEFIEQFMNISKELER